MLSALTQGLGAGSSSQPVLLMFWKPWGGIAMIPQYEEHERVEEGLIILSIQMPRVS